eukprot:NODE_4257_length_326_cov_28.628159_g4175_i0.p1 GENE.NODE_4257_length_326_cov_28.628159_g4175_i0~~NODE_4257_length_326_cov_28.628159_g4175_i0.p1  ORF type:complete len:63 (-),score=31.17 NODE_4257_length_326_cov_28.628159_g4175_i0:138-305(-)
MGGASREIVIVGAHEDSINSGNPSSGRSPGADDYNYLVQFVKVAVGWAAELALVQ